MSTNPGAYGSVMFPALPYMGLGAGLQTPYGTLLPPSGRVIYVRSTLAGDADEQPLLQNMVTTLAAALKQCRSGKFDTVIVLPGHTENVTDATMLDNLVDGTRIIGVGTGSATPTFRWTATASQWAIDNNDISIQGLRLRLEGANGVVKAILITGADVTIQGCDIEVASGATAKATIAIEVGSAAHRCAFVQNRFRGTATHNVTDGIKVVGATPPSDLLIAGNDMIFSATAGNGLVHVTVASKSLNIKGNYMYNTHTSSTACVAVDAVAADGVASENYFGTLNDGVATAQGITFGAGALIKCFQNFSCDEPIKSGVLTPGAVAT